MIGIVRHLRLPRFRRYLADLTLDADPVNSILTKLWKRFSPTSISPAGRCPCHVLRSPWEKSTYPDHPGYYWRCSGDKVWLLSITISPLPIGSKTSTPASMIMRTCFLQSSPKHFFCPGSRDTVALKASAPFNGEPDRSTAAAASSDTRLKTIFLFNSLVLYYRLRAALWTVWSAMWSRNFRHPLT